MHDPHDRLFRRVFSDVKHAEGELRALLPASVSARIDWPTLRSIPTSFVRDVLTELRSDVLFSVQMEGRELLVYLLLEHQSTQDGLMAFRLLAYDDLSNARDEALRALPPDAVERIQRASLAELDRWLERILAAKSVDEVVSS